MRLSGLVLSQLTIHQSLCISTIHKFLGLFPELSFPVAERLLKQASVKKVSFCVVFFVTV